MSETNPRGAFEVMTDETIADTAALYVDKAGAYAGFEGVELWDEARDARNYRGPHPVVAHPPCNWWSMPLAKVNRTRYAHEIGRDGGCFAHAWWAVRTFGGVLEHPANTSAWEFFGIRKPERGGWLEADPEWRWGSQAARTADLGPGEPQFHPLRRSWVCQVSQSAYGHQAIKRTWLLYVGHEPPPELDWSEPPATAVTSWLQRTSTTLPRISKQAAKQTPLAFRDALLHLARWSRRAL